jgi:hypothetical protein
VNEEGWYVDPFGHHEARWISDGVPTALVRDGSVETQDPPPFTHPEGELQRMTEQPSVDGDDLKRADQAQSEEFDPAALTDRASEAIDGIAGF